MEKKTMGSFIAVLRKSNGMTQQEVADRLNVSNKTISKWECDESYPEITLIPVLAELFGVTSDEILKGERIREDTTQKAAVKIDLQIKRLIKSSLVNFKNISFIAMALVIVGMICMLVFAYNSIWPSIGFGVLLIFMVISLILETVQKNLTNAALKDNDILADESQMLKDAYITIYKYTFIVFFMNAVAFVFALPFVLFDNIIGSGSYLSCVPLMVFSLMFIFSVLRKILGRKIPKEVNQFDILSSSNNKTSLNIIQSIVLLLGMLLLAIYQYYIFAYVFYSFVIIAFVSILVLVIKGKGKHEKILVLITGIRNLVYSILILDAVKDNYRHNEGFYIFIVMTILYLIARHFIFIRKYNQQNIVDKILSAIRL